MKIATTELLTALLERAVSTTQVLDRRHGMAPSPMPMNTYRTLLRSIRAAHNPSARMYTQSLRPVIQDAELKGQLTDILKAHFHECVHDDQIQSAVFAINGGATGGFKIENLLEHWLDIAIARGSSYAANAFFEGLKAPRVTYKKMTLLKGLRTDREIEVSNGIRLVPLPNSSGALPHYLPELYGPTGPRPEDIFLDTILVVDASVAPVFVNPTKTVGDDSGMPDRREVFTFKDASGERLGFDTKQFCEALSLVAKGAVRYGAWWSHLDEDHICKVRTSYGYGYDPTAFDRHGTGFVGHVTEGIVQDALSLYQARRGLDAKTAAPLEVSIGRWIGSHTDKLLVDKFIDLGIALESLYLNDGNTSELRFRLALYAAWHLGASSSERTRLMREFRTIYDLRSKAVHTGLIDDDQATRDIWARAQEHCRQAIIKCITDGGFPEWDRLVVN